MKNKNILKKSRLILGLVAFQIAPVAVILFHLFSFRSYNEEPGWVTSMDGNCKFFTLKNSAHRSFEWSGGCKEGLIHGEGKLSVFESGRKLHDYEGSVKEGKLNGFGSVRFAFDGDVYEGHFVDQNLQGFGRFYNDDGDHYEGWYHNWTRSGHGTYWYEPDREEFKYVGNWKDDLPNGFGTLYYRDGRTTYGFFVEGVLTKEQEPEPTSIAEYPKNVLITNDDGVEDMNRLICVAEAISEQAEMVVIVASSSNRSGTSSFSTMTRTGSITTKLLSVDKEKNIYVFETDGYPADCVLLGGLGVFQQQGKSIDLVVSGINGGANEGISWFGSGTIGAARTAALAGIPAIAFSGINENLSGEKGLNRLCKWVADFAGSEAVMDMRPYEYLTVSIPDNLDQIRGVKVIERAISFDNPPFYLEQEQKINEMQIGKEATWYLKPSDPSSVYKMPAENDVFYYQQGYIVVVPMSVNENNPARISQYRSHESALWKRFQDN